MELLFMQVLNMSISAGWMILAVLVLRLALRRTPKWISVAMWGLVGLRLALPFSVESAFSLLPSAKTISPAIQYAQHPAIQSGVQSIDNTVNPVLGSSLGANPANSVNPVQVLLFVGSVIWIIGVSVLLLYGVFSYVRMKRKVRASIPLEQGVLVSDEVTTPFVLGILSPRVYLPSGMDEAERGYVLAHERAHLRRGDHLWKPLGFLLLAVHWFNPMVWLAYVLLCRDIELACDEQVIRDLNLQEKKEYAHALVSRSMQRRMVMVCPLAFGEVGVKQRVKEVLNYRKPAFWIVTGAVAACVVVALCFLTDPHTKQLQISFPMEDIFEVSVYDIETVEEAGIWRMNGAETQEFYERLRDLKDVYRSNEFAGLTPCYTISASVKYGDDLQVRGYHTNGTMTEIYYQGHTYRVTDSEFEQYVRGVCALKHRTESAEAENTLPPLEQAQRQELEQYRTDYVGDAVKVSQIAMRLPYPEDYAYHHIEIQPSAEPYGITIYLTGSGEVTSEDFDTCSNLAFELIGNLGWIRFQGVDNDDVSFRHDKDAQLLSENAVEKIPAVMVDGQLYYSTGQERTGFVHGDDMDGEITSTVDGTKFPTENNQSNFGTGYVYQLESGGMLDVRMDDQWIIFVPADDYEARFDTSPVSYQGDGYVGIRWNNRRYVPYCAISNSDRGAQLGVVDSDESNLIYEYKGCAPEDWIISFLHSGLMDSAMLMRETHVTTIPDGLQSEYEWNQLPAPEIDYGTSSLYSCEDMDAAIGVILTEFSTWEGCELHNIRYTSDECNSPEYIRWLNELNESAEGDRKLDITFTRCIEFVSDYHSPKNAELAGAWNVDEEYTDWQWWLGCTEDGGWHLMSWGY